MGTKGTWRRPAAVDDNELAARWAAAFGPPDLATNHDRYALNPPDGPEVAETGDPR